jgi:hypothetical protein
MPRYVDWPLRRRHVHGPSLAHRRGGQLPGTAEKTAAASEAAALAEPLTIELTTL